MIQLKSFVNALLLCGSLFPLIANASETEDRKFIEAAYKKTASAILDADPIGALAYMAPDYIFTEVGGEKMKLPAIKSIMGIMFKQHNYTKVDTKITKFVWKKDQAIVDTTVYSSGTTYRPDDRKHTFEYISRSQETWSKTAKGWRVKATKAIDGQSTIDGKKQPTPKIGGG